MDKKFNKIMLVDDSENLRMVIKEYLEIKGYSVWDFKDCDTASKAFNTTLFNLCIIDLSMRSQEDFALLQTIRKYDKNMPIVLLSNSDSREDRIKGFKLGCDDFISKPFSIEELELRIQAILRRSQLLAPANTGIYEEKLYRLGNFVFNFSDMQLIHPKATRTLTRKEAELLKLLCDHKNKLIPREIILKEVWGDEDHAVGRRNPSLQLIMALIGFFIQPS